MTSLAKRCSGWLPLALFVSLAAFGIFLALKSHESVAQAAQRACHGRVGSLSPDASTQSSSSPAYFAVCANGSIKRVRPE